GDHFPALRADSQPCSAATKRRNVVTIAAAMAIRSPVRIQRMFPPLAIAIPSEVHAIGMLDTQERIALTCVNPQELSRISTNGSRPTTGRRQNTNRFSSEKVPSRHFEPSQGTVSPAVEG